MPVKKKEDPVNSNVNNNTNNNTNNNVNNNHVNVHVNIPKPRATAKKKQETKPNWIVKAVVLALIGLAVTVIGYYLTNQSSQKHNPDTIGNAPAINGELTN